MNAKVLIGTPTHSGWVHANYTMSLVRSLGHAGRCGIRSSAHVMRGNVLPQTRNLLARAALENDFSHLLFTDSDMAWPPEAIDRLLSWSKDAVGGVYQSRQDGQFLIFNPRRARGDEPLLEVDAIATGFLLLSRFCLEQMVEAYPGRMFEFCHGSGEDSWALVNEDIAFCTRWRAKGGQVYADPSFRLHHFGEKDFSTALHEALAEGGATCGHGQQLLVEELTDTSEAVGTVAQHTVGNRRAGQ